MKTISPPTKIKIIWIIDGLGHGGAERLTLSILEKFDRTRFDIRVCALQVRQGNPIAQALEAIGIPVDLVPIPNLRNPANLPRLIQYLRTHRPHLIHTQLQFATILGSIAARLLGIPNITTLHTLDKPEEGTSFWRNQIMWTILRFFCDRVIAVSESTRQHHMRFGKIPAEKIFTIYNGLDLQKFKPLDTQAHAAKRKDLGLELNAIVAVTVAVLRAPKGIQFMLEAMTQLCKKNPDLQYLVVGDGDHGPALKEIVKKHNLEKQVIFAGQRNDIGDILAVSDFFVLPTLTEALPTVLIEAMASQKAIIASAVGGVPEMITTGVNGLLVPPADPSALAKACQQLIDNMPQRAAFAAQGLNICQEKFDLRVQINALETLYQNLLEKKKP
jgi:glycosyltransferase involved in cell wall biosynthesis